MLFDGTKYLAHFLQSKLIVLALLMTFCTTSYSQNTTLPKDTLLIQPINPVVAGISNKPVKLMTLHINPPYKPYFAKRGGELMHWPNYPLTAGQIIARETEWQRRNSQSVGEMVAGDIIKNRVNALIYRKKMPVAVQPRF